VDVAAVVRRVLESVRGAIEREKAEVRLGPLPAAWGDPSGIEQIFSNLIGNALRYRDRDRALRIEITGSLAEDGRSVVYSVKDTGSGIPASALPKLFTAFRRFHPEAGPGEGIGLAMVRRIIDRQHGSVRVESRVGEGSTFIVELPGDRAPVK
jgi:signal transduction histidine kinase